MGRGRGKGREGKGREGNCLLLTKMILEVMTKKRGRPQKSLKNKIDEAAARNIGDEDSENHSIGAFDKEVKSSTAIQNGKEAKEKTDAVKEENGNGIRLSIDTSKGFRPDRNRRKNIPRRAAEACVECI